MNVICLILVTFYVGNIGFIQKQQVEGKVLNSNDTNYLVDFSEDAKKHKYTGDYSKVLVNKDVCVEEKQ